MTEHLKTEDMTDVAEQFLVKPKDKINLYGCG